MFFVFVFVLENAIIRRKRGDSYLFCFPFFFCSCCFFLVVVYLCFFISFVHRLYVCGPPGAGKTLCVRHILKQICTSFSEELFTCHWLDAPRYLNSTSFLSGLLDDLETEKSFPFKLIPNNKKILKREKQESVEEHLKSWFLSETNTTHLRYVWFFFFLFSFLFFFLFFLFFCVS